MSSKFVLPSSRAQGSAINSLLEDRSMARQRWQSGSIRLENKHNPVYVGRYLEDVVMPDGSVKRVQKSVRLGTKKEFPTERLARRELQRLLEPINAVSYKPTTRITFKDFTDKWIRDVLGSFKPAGQASTKSNIKILNTWFAGVEMSAISNEMIQKWIAQRKEYSPKTILNYVTTLQRLWGKAKQWKYVTGDSPFEGLLLPAAELKQQPSFTPEQAREIIQRAEEPYKSMFWIVAETGIRGGELCGIYKDDIDFTARMIIVRRSAFQGQLQTTKTGNSVRSFPISSALAEHIRAYVGEIAPKIVLGGKTPSDLRAYTESVQGGQLCGTNLIDKFACADITDASTTKNSLTNVATRTETTIRVGSTTVSAPVLQSLLLFRTPRGCPYDNGNIVKRGLKPILRAMGIDAPRVGLHAFRHSSASAMDSLGTPERVRMDRLGHGSMKMTMKYSHSNSQDHRAAADALGALFAPEARNVAREATKPAQDISLRATVAEVGSDKAQEAESRLQPMTLENPNAKRDSVVARDSHTETVQEPEYEYAVGAD